MGTKTLAVLVTIAFSVIGVLGDYFLKLASVRDQPLRAISFYLGFALYASTAFGWVFVMKYLNWLPSVFFTLFHWCCCLPRSVWCCSGSH